MRLNVAVVSFDGVDNGFGFLVLSCDVDADGDMAALDLMVDGLADIVQQACALCDVHIDAQLRGHKTGEVGDLDGVVEHVLAVAGAVLHAAEQLDDLGVQAVDIRLERGALALGLDSRVDFLLRLGDHFLDTRRVDAAVLNELFERQTRDLAADGIEARDGDRLGGIVNDKVTAGQRFDAADVAALAADYASLHLVVGEGYDGDGDLACMIRGAALDGRGNDLSCALVGLVLILRLDLLDLDGHLVGDLVADAGDQIILGLFDGEAGDLLEHFELALLHQSDFLLLCFHSGDLAAENVVLLLDGVQLSVKIFFLLLVAALLLGQLGAALLDLPLVFRAAFVYFFLCLKESFSLLALRTFYRFVNYALGFFFSTGYFAFGNLFAVAEAYKESRYQSRSGYQDP